MKLFNFCGVKRNYDRVRDVDFLLNENDNIREVGDES